MLSLFIYFPPTNQVCYYNYLPRVLTSKYALKCNQIIKKKSKVTLLEQLKYFKIRYFHNYNFLKQFSYFIYNNNRVKIGIS